MVQGGILFAMSLGVNFCLSKKIDEWVFEVLDMSVFGGKREDLMEMASSFGASVKKGKVGYLKISVFFQSFGF